MTKLIVIFAVVFATGTIFVNQRPALSRALEQRTRLVSQREALREREEAVRSQTAAAERMLARLQSELQWNLDHARADAEEGGARQPSPLSGSEKVVPPDPALQGGWPATAAYFYLPKQHLASVGYTLIESNRLSDEAARLFGMTDGERESVDAAYDRMWHSFRTLEIERMTPVELPADWQERRETLPRPFRDERLGDQLTRYVTYRIPSLADEGSQLLAEFTSSLQQTLGPVRAQYLSARLGQHAEEKLDDLGSRARVITFHEERHERDGQTRLYYTLTREGLDSTTTVIQFPLEPDSQTVYYARLLGVQVPVKDP